MSVGAFKEFAQSPNAKDFEDNFLSETESYIVAGLEATATVAAYRMRTLGMTPKTFRSKWNGRVDYSQLKEPRKVGPGLETTSAQRKRILEYNKKINGGIIRSHEDGSFADIPANVPKGEKANMKQAEIDHMEERVNGGTNSNSNLRVVTKEQNLDRESKRQKKWENNLKWVWKITVITTQYVMSGNSPIVYVAHHEDGV